MGLLMLRIMIVGEVPNMNWISKLFKRKVDTSIPLIDEDTLVELDAWEQHLQDKIKESEK